MYWVSFALGLRGYRSLDSYEECQIKRNPKRVSFRQDESFIHRVDKASQYKDCIKFSYRIYFRLITSKYFRIESAPCRSNDG